MTETVEHMLTRACPDQLRALDCMGHCVREIMESDKPVIFGAFYIGRPDLLQDRQIIWYGNVIDTEFRDLLRHALSRIEKKLEAKP